MVRREWMCDATRTRARGTHSRKTGSTSRRQAPRVSAGEPAQHSVERKPCCCTPAPRRVHSSSTAHHERRLQDLELRDFFNERSDARGRGWELQKPSTPALDGSAAARLQPPNTAAAAAAYVEPLDLKYYQRACHVQVLGEAQLAITVERQEAERLALAREGARQHAQPIAPQLYCLQRLAASCAEPARARVSNTATATRTVLYTRKYFDLIFDLLF